MIQKLKHNAKRLKSNLTVLYLSYKDPNVAWYAKLFAICVVAYAFSPIDLIPDFIPILGLLDDLVIVPLGIYLALKMIPGEIIEANRTKAREMRRKPSNWFVAALFVIIWVFLAIWIALQMYAWI